MKATRSHSPLLAVAMLASLSLSANSAFAYDFNDLVGQWNIRIDGGGEIYSSELELEMGDDGETLEGKYEAEGRKGRVLSVTRETGYYVLEVASRRSGMAARGLFMFELIDGKMQGDVDFEVGTSVRSYAFEAELAAGPEKKAAPNAPTADPNPESETSQSISTNKQRGKVSFCNGDRGYNETIDTEIWAIAPSKALDRQGTMTADGNNGGGESQVLMKFANVFGGSEGQAPVGSRIVSATLSIVVFDPGSTVYLHRVLAPWRESATWDGMAAGLSIDNVEASTVRDGFSFGQINMDRQLVEFDVTATVQKWSDGEPNLGWVFVNTGGNGWDFYSSDWIEPDLRPRLDIEYETR